MTQSNPQVKTPTQAQQWRELLSHLWRGGAYGCFWSAPAKRTVWVNASDPTAAHPPKWEGRQNVYFGVHPLTAIPPTNSSGEATPAEFVRSQLPYIAALNCLFAEFDAKDFEGGKPAIMAHLEDLWNSEDAIPYPSVVVDSGGGYHCYWLLEYTVTVTDENRAALDALQKAWVDLVGSDDGAKDLARVLRVPGTVNRKPERGPDFPTVTFHEANFRLVYDLALFEALTEHLRRPTPARAAPTVTTSHNGAFGTDEDKAARWLARLVPRRADDYATWVAVGMALSELGGAGLQLWEQWSAQSAKYQPGVCEAKWKTFAPGNGLTLGSLKVWADEDDPARAIVPVGVHCRRMAVSPHNGAGFEADTPDPANLEGRSYAKYAAADGFVFDLPYDKFRAEDGGILDAWRSLPESEDWIFVPEHGDWARWAGTHWERGAGAQLYARIQSLMDSINLQGLDAMRAAYADMAALGKEDEEERGALSAEAAQALAMVKATKRSAARVRSVIELAQAWCTVPVTDLDAGNLLNLANGTLDLDTGNFTPHRRADRLTYTLPYSFDAGADCPRWRRFLSEVLVNVQTLEPDTDLAGLAQELVGLSLTTDTRHEIMAWLSGEGGTGKSTFLHVLGRLLGPLSIRVDFQGLDRPNDYSLAKLPGRRVALSTEAQKGGGAGERWIKSIVSGEPIPAREIYGRPFEFTPVCKVWWAMNDRPVIKDTSDAIWRRLVLIPFNRQFTPEERDRDLTRKLEAEMPGILNWALEGLARLRSRGRLPEVQAVTAAVSEYRHETNAVAQWLAERTVKNAAAVTRAAAAFNDYAAWSKDNGRLPMNNTNFGRELARLGHDKARDSKGYFYRFGLVDERDAPPLHAEAQTPQAQAAPESDEVLETLGL